MEQNLGIVVWAGIVVILILVVFFGWVVDKLQKK